MIDGPLMGGEGLTMTLHSLSHHLLYVVSSHYVTSSMLCHNMPLIARKPVMPEKYLILTNGRIPLRFFQKMLMLKISVNNKKRIKS